MQPRQPFSTLPVIPASPRESQNVFDSSEPTPTGIVLSHADDVQFAVYDPPSDEQDITEPLPTPMFAIPHYAGESEYSTYNGEQDVVAARGNKVPPRISVPHSRTPSLLTRSESVRTELTYLTAQDSRPGSRRVSAVRPVDAERGNFSGQADGDTTLVDPSPEKRSSPVAKLKASFESLMHRTRSGKLPSTRFASLSHLKWLAFVHSGGKGQGSSEGDEHYRKPAELLFWAGFLFPWCWLIGGWLLARSGEMTVEGLPRGVRDNIGPKTPHSASTVFHIQKQPSSGQPPTVTPGWSAEGQDLEKGSRAPFPFEKDGRSAWSSADLLASLAGSGHQSTPGPDNGKGRSGIESGSGLKPLMLRASVLASPEEYYLERRLDRWVIRCRIAAVISGFVLLILIIVALIAVGRAL